MRISSKVFVSSIGLGIMAISYAAGAQAQSDPSFSANGATDSGSTPVTSTAPVDTSSPTPTTTTIVKKHTAASSASSSSTTTTVKKTVTKKHTTTSTATPTTTPTTTPTATPTSTPTAPASGGTVTHQSSPIPYHFGTIQLSVTKTNGKITDISKVVFQASGGRASAWSTLVQAAESANGANFGNIGGATYTTQAFKDALKSALAKF